MNEEITRLIAVNAELRSVIGNFLESVVDTNNIPWFMVHSALVDVLKQIDERQNLEVTQARKELATPQRDDEGEEE